MFFITAFVFYITGFYAGIMYPLVFLVFLVFYLEIPAMARLSGFFKSGFFIGFYFQIWFFRYKKSPFRGLVAI